MSRKQTALTAGPGLVLAPALALGLVLGLGFESVDGEIVLGAIVATEGLQAPPSPAAAELEAMIQRGDLQGALNYGRAHLTDHRDDPAFREQLGGVYFLLQERLGQRGGDPALIARTRGAALEHLRAARNLQPRARLRTYAAIAQLELLVGDPRRSADTSSTALNAYPRTAPLLALRARARAELGAWDGAADDWEAVLATDPRHVEAALGRAEAWSHLGRPCDAAEALRKDCLESGTPATQARWDLHYSIGRYLILCQKYEDSLPYLEEAGRLAPEEGMVAVERAEMFHRVGRTDEARDLLDAWIDRLEALDRPQRIQALYRRGWIAEREGDRERATALLERVLALEPIHGGALQILGRLARLSGDETRARAYAERFRRVAPIALDIRIARQMIRRQPEVARLRVELIDHLLSILEVASARLEFDDFARRFPGHPQSSRLRTRLTAAERGTPGSEENE